MIRIAVTEAALVAIAKILPEGTVLQIDRRGGQCFIHLKEAMADRLGAMRGPGESYSDVILRVAQASGAPPDVLGCTSCYQASAPLSYRASALVRRGGTRP